LQTLKFNEGSVTFTTLNSTNIEGNMQTLRLNSEGTDLDLLIKELKEAELLEPKFKSKKFDFTISAAVKIFQSINIDSRGIPLTVDGVVGPLTWAALQARDQTDIFIAAKKSQNESNTPRCGPDYSETNDTAFQALSVAFDEMSKGAGEQGGNNQGPYVAKYHRSTEDILEVKQWSWCAAFVSFCFRNGAASIKREMPFKYSGGAQNVLKQFQAKGWGYKISDMDPKPGDIVVWKRGSASWMGHIGIVTDYRDGILYTIEGNRGRYPSMVSEYSYVLSSMESLFGFGRIPKDF
jgi:hypothetical protein